MIDFFRSDIGIGAVSVSIGFVIGAIVIKILGGDGFADTSPLIFGAFTLAIATHMNRDKG